jgi:hypothetical protein
LFKISPVQSSEPETFFVKWLLTLISNFQVDPGLCELLTLCGGDSAGDGTPGLMYARQVLYHPSPSISSWAVYVLQGIYQFSPCYQV